VLSNIKDMVEAAGGTMADIVLANVYVTDMSYYDYQGCGTSSSSSRTRSTPDRGVATRAP
jgi:enamine deaminase RidA (YjgF/YER057c/UK114 family)